MLISLFFFFNDTATTEIYTLSLHDALPISLVDTDPNDLTLAYLLGTALLHQGKDERGALMIERILRNGDTAEAHMRSEEHTSELQSRLHIVCRLLLEKKKQ